MQLVFTLLLITAAVGYVGRAAIRTWTADGCGSSCGKCAAPPEVVKPGRIPLA